MDDGRDENLTDGRAATAERRAEALDVLESNRAEGYTVPSATLYPFQWNWDSAFIALGLAGVEPEAAKAELETLCAATWENGLLPHIVFHTDAEGYFPGPKEWGVDVEEVATSGITQPPMVVPAARRVYETTGDDEFLERVYPALERHLEWWIRERSFDRKVVYVRHPWETGMDDSPAWTDPLEAFDPGAVEYEREDRKSDDLADQRPTDWDYDRYVALVRAARAADWDEFDLRESCPFLVEDALTNAIFVRACDDFAVLSAARGDDAAAAMWREQAEQSREAIRDRLWDDELGTFVSYDRVGDRKLRANSVAGLASLFGEIPTNERFERHRRTLRKEFLAFEFAAPSYVGDAFDPDRYWRGPVWINTNWLVADGLRRYGATDLADRIDRDSRRLVEREGFREYFNPETGEGRGSDRFSWSAALYLELTDRQDDFRDDER
ncbi:amylo-alpha-1,6-glucosidase [Haloprofundus salilacus]|uniref:amylo-alpha-1,6-glucosidase n=1 Tax=Haloprofundus salilacus TaxID=2876190 RepID=UPI001CCF52AD|nr:trehalase family glycosidase [Haloprofundus salilacus]